MDWVKNEKEKHNSCFIIYEPHWTHDYWTLNSIMCIGLTASAINLHIHVHVP